MTEKTPKGLTGKATEEAASQSAERPVPRLAGCIRPLATAQHGAATERNLDGSVKRLGRGTKEDWWKQKETWWRREKTWRRLKKNAEAKKRDLVGGASCG